MRKSVILFLVLFFVSCLYLDNVSQPASVRIGENFTITVRGWFSGTYISSNRGWFAIMLPLGFVIDSIRYTTRIGITELLTQTSDTVTKLADYNFPPDPNMFWWGYETQSYNGSDSSSYEAIIYAKVLNFTNPGNYLIDYRTGNSYNNTLADDSILNQPLQVISAAITEGQNSKIENQSDLSELEVYPNPFKTRLIISSKSPGIIKILNKVGDLVRTIYINSSQGCWDGKNNKGERVPPGTYFIKIGGAKGKVTLLD